MEPNQPAQQTQELPPTPPQPITPLSPNIASNMRESQPSKLPTILLVLVSLLSLTGLIYFYFQTLSLKEQLTIQPAPTPQTPTTTQPSPTVDPIANWKTYTNKDLHITFKYPSQFIVTEPTPGFLVIKNSNDPVAQAGISIETRRSGSYATYNQAESYFQNSFDNTETKNIGMWQVFQGKGREGMLQGVEFRSGITEYKGGALETEVLANTDYAKYFDQILSTFKFTE